MMSGLTSTRKVSREQLTQNYRRGAVNYLFMYLYVLRFGRPPEGWEISLARSFLSNEVVFLVEPENEDVKRIFDLMLDVERAMNLIERKDELQTESVRRGLSEVMERNGSR